MIEETGGSFKFEVEKIGSDVDENGDVEIDIRHDGRFVEHVRSYLDTDDFDEEMIKEFLVKMVYSYAAERRKNG